MRSPKAYGDLHSRIVERIRLWQGFDGGGNLVYWYDADSRSAALTEQEKPNGPTDADVRRLADEIKSLKRPQQ